MSKLYYAWSALRPSRSKMSLTLFSTWRATCRQTFTYGASVTNLARFDHTRVQNRELMSTLVSGWTAKQLATVAKIVCTFHNCNRQWQTTQGKRGWGNKWSTSSQHKCKDLLTTEASRSFKTSCQMRRMGVFKQSGALKWWTNLQKLHQSSHKWQFKMRSLRIMRKSRPLIVTHQSSKGYHLTSVKLEPRKLSGNHKESFRQGPFVSLLWETWSKSHSTNMLHHNTKVSLCL